MLDKDSWSNMSRFDNESISLMLSHLDLNWQAFLGLFHLPRDSASNFFLSNPFPSRVMLIDREPGKTRRAVNRSQKLQRVNNDKSMIMTSFLQLCWNFQSQSVTPTEQFRIIMKANDDDYVLSFCCSSFSLQTRISPFCLRREQNARNCLERNIFPASLTCR